MKAVVLTKQGPGAKLRYESVLTPVPKIDEALVKVLFCGLNHLDLLIKEGKRPGPGKFPHILGSEFVGVIKMFGGKTGRYIVGDTVAVYPWTFCGKCTQCKTDYEQICDKGGTLGRTRWGGFAQYATVPVQNLIRLGKDVAQDQICALTLAGTTAVHLVERVQIRRESSVLVTGATGGVGTVVIQLLKLLKCNIVCCTSHPEKIKLLKKLGADFVVSTKDLFDQVMHVFPKGVDYAIDIMGGDIWSEAVRTLTKNATMSFCSTTMDGAGTINIGTAFSKQVTVKGSYGGARKDLIKAIDYLEKGLITPQIDSVYTLKNTAAAFKKLQNQDAFGKILIRVN